ncbi:MAG: LysM peptidoglycan-binding domain-containing protein [Gammaproteobacteria bacterium]
MSARTRAFAKLILLPISAVCLIPSVSLGYSDTFPVPQGLRPQVEFWKNVFTKFSKDQVVIHDALYVDKIYTVMDLPPLPEDGNSAISKLRRTLIAEEKTHIKRLLDRLHRNRRAFNAEEAKIYRLFGDVNQRNKFLDAKERLNGQTGVRERFRKGLERAGRYLPHMEAVFRDHGLPVELTRLPLIESSFDVNAYSRAAAAGIWQFIPSSARIYGLRINTIVDDRRDPLLATTAAARHLRDDYRALRAWPLAVTAYNHGRGGMARAVEAVGSRDLAQIIKYYSHPRFGFASRNFYVEFLAAVEIYRHPQRYFTGLRPQAPLDFREVALEYQARFPSLAKRAGLDPLELLTLNPRFQKAVAQGRLQVPPGYRVVLPRAQAASFRNAYAQFKPRQELIPSPRLAKTDPDAKTVHHRVRRGQSLGWIARYHGTSISAIKQVNGIRNVNHIRSGHLLRIPSVGARETTERVFVNHRVRSGQTVSTIARRYQTTIRAIIGANALSNKHRVRVGQMLRIPQ